MWLFTEKKNDCQTLYWNVENRDNEQVVDSSSINSYSCYTKEVEFVLYLREDTNESKKNEKRWTLFHTMSKSVRDWLEVKTVNKLDTALKKCKGQQGLV